MCERLFQNSVMPSMTANILSEAEFGDNITLHTMLFKKHLLAAVSFGRVLENPELNLESMVA
jgi:hypothetical protein